MREVSCSRRVWRIGLDDEDDRSCWASLLTENDRERTDSEWFIE